MNNPKQIVSKKDLDRVREAGRAKLYPDKIKNGHNPSRGIGTTETTRM